MDNENVTVTGIIGGILGVVLVIAFAIAGLYFIGCLSSYFAWNIINLFAIENGFKMINFFVFRNWIIQWTFVTGLLNILNLLNKK